MLNYFRKLLLLCLLLHITFSCNQNDYIEDLIDKNSPLSKKDALSVNQVLQLYPQSIDSLIIVQGIIVGNIQGTTLSKANFSAPFSQASNILIADSLGVSDAARCIPIQLTANSKSRALLNLVDNPQNFGKRLILQGTIATYFQVCGIKKIAEYELGEPVSLSDSVDSSLKSSPFIVLEKR